MCRPAMFLTYNHIWVLRLLELVTLSLGAVDEPHSVFHADPFYTKHFPILQVCRTFSIFSPGKEAHVEPLISKGPILYHYQLQICYPTVRGQRHIFASCILDHNVPSTLSFRVAFAIVRSGRFMGMGWIPSCHNRIARKDTYTHIAHRRSHLFPFTTKHDSFSSHNYE